MTAAPPPPKELAATLRNVATISPSSSWASIEDLRPDQDAIDIAEQAAEEVDRIWGTIADRIAVMYRWHNGQPQAACTQPGSGDTPMWCERHERDLHGCHRDGLLCNGIPYRPGSDPTGEAATQPDRAAADHQRVLKLLRLRTRTDRELVNVLAAYPPHPVRLERAKSAGADWCASCYRDGQYHEPVATKPNGTVYHSDLCRWCGGFRAEHHIDPPLRLLRMHHEGRRLTVTEVAEAVAEYQQQERAGGKKGKKGKRG